MMLLLSGLKNSGAQLHYSENSIQDPKLRVFLNKAYEFSEGNSDSLLYYSLKAFQIAQEKKSDDGLTESILFMSKSYERKNDFDNAVKILKKGIEFSKKNDNDTNNIKLSIILGDLFYKTGNYPSALSMYQKALSICSLIGDFSSQGEILNSIGVVHKFKGEYAEALNYHMDALKLYEENNYNPGIAASLGNIGNVHESLGNYDKALEKYLKALEVFKKMNDESQIANSFMNIGVIYFNIDKKEEALKNFLHAYQIAAKINNSLIKSYSLNNIAYAHAELGNYDESIKFYEKALKTAEEAGDKWGITNTLNNMSNVYMAKGESEAALRSVNRAFEIAKEIEAKDLVLESYKILSQLYETKANYSQALKYHKLYKEINDSLFEKESQKRIVETNIKYETEKKEKEIKNLQLTEQRRIILFTVITIVLVTIIAIINYALYWQKKKSALFLYNVINSLTHPFIVYDVFGGINELLNKAAKENNSPYHKFIKANNYNFVPYAKDKVIEKRLPCSIEFEETINGSRKFFECYGFPVFNNKMNITKIIEYAVDITEKKEAINKIRTAFEREKELNELKSNFISSTSHEFRTPLATLFSSVELIQHYDLTKSDEKKLYHLARIKDIVVYMTKMLDNILTINKAEVNKIEFEPEIVNLRAFSSEIVEDIIIAASDKHLVDQVIEGNADSIFIDPNLVRHILTNLLTNAIKYSPTGGQILFKIEVLNNQVRFTVRDEGIGIPKADFKNLFQYFFRARNSRTISGTGLGLSIVKKSVEVHGGTIEFTSNEGEGTTFIVTLPTNRNFRSIKNS